MIEFEIDGKKIHVEQGSTIIEAADANGVYIPRFCYHKNLSIAANCRMCLVEVEKMGKPQPACATPVTPDMKVFTQSEKALAAQRAVMEFLLINHPLDCPICDQGGECDLQDQAMGYGSPYSYYTEAKRAVFSDDLGPLIETEMTRCIQCTRCVRFGEEVAGLRELGATFRGEDMQIGTYVKHFMQSELSGNIIDICPVGALTNKPARYTERGWELQEHAMIGPHDCVGTNMYIHTRGHQNMPQRTVMRAVSRENNKINDTWMSDRDRFSCHALYHSDRLLRPRIKQQGQWKDIEWEKALTEISAAVQVIIEHHGAQQIAALASPNSTVEEFYLLQKLMRSLGSQNIDHRIHEQDFRDQHLVPEFPNLGMGINEIADLSTILLIGSNVRSEQPLLSHQINKAAQDGAVVMTINPIDYHLTFNVAQKVIGADLVYAVAQLAKVLADEKGMNVAALSDVQPSEAARTMAQQLKAEGAAIFLGDFAMSHPHASQLRGLVRLIANFTNAKIGVFTRGANSSGAWLAGAVPHRGPAGATVEKPGLNARQLLTTEPAQVVFLLNIEPEFDSAFSAAALQALQRAGLVVCMTTYVTPAMLEYADFILPITPYTETDGTYVNAAGAWQKFSAASVPTGDCKPAWKVLRVLANFLHVAGFDYKTTHQVREELAEQIDLMSQFAPVEHPLEKVTPLKQELLRIATPHMYRIDPLVRRSEALQQTINEQDVGMRMNQATAAHYQLAANDIVQAQQGDSSVILPLHIDNRIANHLVLIPEAFTQTAAFGSGMTSVTLTKVRGMS